MYILFKKCVLLVHCTVSVISRVNRAVLLNYRMPLLYDYDSLVGDWRWDVKQIRFTCLTTKTNHCMLGEYVIKAIMSIYMHFLWYVICNMNHRPGSGASTEDSSLTAGVIAVIIISCLIGLFIIILLVVLCCCGIRK